MTINKIIVVLGMHRSGTSVLTRGLQELGVTLGENLQPAGLDNPKGYWEDLDVLTLNERVLKLLNLRWDSISPVTYAAFESPEINKLRLEAIELIRIKTANVPLWGFKDPRTIRLLPFWQATFRHLELIPQYIIALRNPISIAKSLKKRNGFSFEKSCLLWLQHTIPVIIRTTEAKRSVIDYDQLLDNPVLQFERIAKTFELPMPAEGKLGSSEYLTDYLTENLRHNLFTTDDLIIDPIFSSLARKCYVLLLKVALDQLSVDALQYTSDWKYIEESFHELDPFLKYFENLETQVVNLNEEVARYEAHFVDLKQQLASQNEALCQKDNELAEFSQQLASQNEALCQKDNELAEFSQQLASQNEALCQKDNELEQQNKQIAALYHSTSWRIAAPIRFVKHLVQRMIPLIRQWVRSIYLALPLPIAFKLRVKSFIFTMFSPFLKDTTAYRAWQALQSKADVNQSESRETLTDHSNFDNTFLPAPPLSELRKVLKKAISPSERIDAWLPTQNNQQTLASQDLDANLDKAISTSTAGLAISLSHDEYTRVIGGLQNCVNDEEQSFKRANWTYIHLCPAQFLPRLVYHAESEDFLVILTVNGTRIGTAILTDFITWLVSHKSLFPKLILTIHQLLGFDTELVKSLFDLVCFDVTYFWIHDYFSICPGYQLLRNDIAFCGAPHFESGACQVCVYGEERPKHFDLMVDLFETIKPVVVAPAKVTLDQWSASCSYTHLDRKIIPLASIEYAISTEGDTPVLSPGTYQYPLRVAFLGFPYYFKGWQLFERLARQFDKDPRYDFFHLGSNQVTNTNITFINVQVTRDDRYAMCTAVDDNHIDVVLIWPLCPETFSFTTHEAIAGGAYIITHKNSGNVWPAVEFYDQGRMVETEEDLVSLFESGDLIPPQHINSRRRGYLNISGCTAECVLAEGVK